MENLGTFLTKRREELGLNPAEAARLTGVSRDYIVALEEGVNRGTGKSSSPSPQILRKLASGYNVPFPMLMSLAGHWPSMLPPSVMDWLFDPRNENLLEWLSDPENQTVVEWLSRPEHQGMVAAMRDPEEFRVLLHSVRKIRNQQI